MTLSSCGCKVPWALRGGCGSCGSLGRSDDTPYHRLWHGCHRLRTSCAAPLSPTAREQFTPWLTISRSADCPMETGDVGECDDCDDCDGIFDTDPTVILIVTTVTNRHTSWFRSRIALPFLVRFTVYSTPYSLSSSPAFTLSCRVRILGCISS